MQIGMDEFLHLPAGRAHTASILPLVSRAKDILGKSQRQRQRAVARLSGEQLGMAYPPALQGMHQPVLDFFLSDYILEHLCNF